MKVAEVWVTSSHSLGAGFTHQVHFDNIEVATAEYQKVADLMLKRKDRSNDLPKMIEIKGINIVSVGLDDICSVGLIDLVKSNAEEMGVKDAFPNLFKR